MDLMYFYPPQCKFLIFMIINYIKIYHQTLLSMSPCRVKEKLHPAKGEHVP